MKKDEMATPGGLGTQGDTDLMRKNTDPPTPQGQEFSLLGCQTQVFPHLQTMRIQQKKRKKKPKGQWEGIMGSREDQLCT